LILVLGGRSEARELAGALHAGGIAVTSALARRVAPARRPAGAVRIGGFGGPEGLAAWLAEHEVPAVVDASHPFAERISATAAQACERRDVPLLRLEREGWRPRAGDRWRWVADLEEASRSFEHNRRVLLTTGPEGVESFAHRDDAWFLIRTADPPQPPLPADHALLLGHGPYTLADELALIDEHGIEIVVTRDRGGADAQAKLDAARERRLPVVIVRRPPRADVPTLTSVDGALRWTRHHGYRRGV
jgi:precorrin-6A/cobalt-precorrin-6A reductase